MGSDPRLQQAFVARAAAILFLASGFLIAVSSELGPAAGRSGAVAVAAVAGLFGVGVWIAPWHRWPARRSVWLAPIALVLIAIGSSFGAGQPYDYAVYFALVHAWVGISQPRWTSLKIAPLTAAAYLLPLSVIAPSPRMALITGITVVPLCVLAGESIAWLRAQLDTSETDRGRLRAALEDGRRSEERLTFLAYHDAVTELPNRAMFDEHLTLAVANARRSDGTFSVCAVDLDKFKLINDTLGHAAGDHLLREVARRLHRTVREGDVLARVGGDEFLMLLPSAEVGRAATGNPDEGRSSTARLMERISKELAAPCMIGETEVHISASVGAAVFPTDANTAKSLLAHADAQMYRQKHGSSERLSQGRADASLSERLRSAARTRPWALHYQPIFELVLGRAVGAEALIRWPDTDEEIGPDRFIPLAEEMGLISSIGGWIVDELESQLLAWRADGTLDGIMALTTNVSPRQLWHPGLLEMFGRLVDAAGRPDLVVLEITESTLGMDPRRALSTLNEMRQLGVRVALDDFGTGYSSLSRLRSLPIDIVKIDRSFMEDIDSDVSARSLLRSALRLIGSLEMVPLAEGIETQAQLDFVRDEGCVLAQGFLLGRPDPASKLAERISSEVGALISLEEQGTLTTSPQTA